MDIDGLINKSAKAQDVLDFKNENINKPKKSKDLSKSNVLVWEKIWVISKILLT